MKDNDVYFKPEPITTDDIAFFDEKVIERCYDESNMYIQSLAELGKEIQGKCITLIGWLIAAASSFTGVLFYMAVDKSGSFALYIVLLYGIIADGAIAWRLISSALYRMPVALAGEEPSHIIRKEVRPYASIRTKEQAYKYILGWELSGKQYKIAVNQKSNGRMINEYRFAFKCALICLLLSPVVFGTAFLLEWLVF